MVLKNVGVCVYRYKMNIGIKVNLINACKVILQPKTKLNKHKKKWKSILHTENGSYFKKDFLHCDIKGIWMLFSMIFI